MRPGISTALQQGYSIAYLSAAIPWTDAIHNPFGPRRRRRQPRISVNVDVDAVVVTLRISEHTQGEARARVLVLRFGN